MTEQITTEETVDEPVATDEETEETTEQEQVETEEETTEEEAETFSREYVQELRDEAAKHRVKAKDRDDLAHRLHTALVAATGRLADPTDLAFDEAHLTDSEALATAIEDLVQRKPHLASRTPRGDVGQGPTGSGEPVDLAAILRARAS